MKKEGIKILDPVKCSKPFTIDLPDRRWIGIIIARDIKARARNFADGIFPLNQIVPKVGQILGVRILARHPHNGNGLFPSQ